MCGIAGIVRTDGTRVDQGDIRAMVDAQRHRGPDGDGIYLRDNIAFGHTRLAIIGVEQGAQPMVSPGDRFALTYNGEIYNYQELRKELIRAGYCFVTDTDTEVLLHGYDHWGEGVLDRLRGMFAFGIADFKTQRLFLARDHAGIKPLVYRQEDDFFSFASELNGLRAFGPPPSGSLQSLEYYIRRYRVPAPHTFFKTIHKLPPATTMSVGFDGYVEKCCRYWRLDFTPSVMSHEEVREELHHRMNVAIDRSRVADVPVGVFCSGGMDSTVVSMLMAQAAGANVSAFYLGFKDEEDQELPYAREAAEKLGLDFHMDLRDDSCLDILPKVINNYGEPFADSSALACHFVSKLAGEHVKVSLSGDGGDELFCGYRRYFEWDRLSTWRRHVCWEQSKLDFRAGRTEGLRDEFGFGPKRWSRFKENTPWFRRRFLFREELRPLLEHRIVSEWDAYEHASKQGHGLSYAQGMDFETYLPDDILFKVDVASMAYGLETRPVLLDVELMEFAASVPDRWKYSPEKGGKLLLQELLRERFSADFIQRKKRGFSVPGERWFKPGSMGRQMLEDSMSSTRDIMTQWFKPEALDETLSNPRHGYSFLWLMLTLSIWLDTNRDVSFDV